MHALTNPSLDSATLSSSHLIEVTFEFYSWLSAAVS